ncbi:MAG TPA: electron transfer flavoprotein subunit alpha/FixB family protein [Longimicrobiales bacterium]|nr:electron transfer flavoprotein subunit alpha/FixB family protein [Longimicrobiales bacterium]
MPGNILVVAEQRDGELRRVSLEALAAGRRLADGGGAEVHAVLVGGDGVAGLAAELGRFGADRVLVAESPALGRYAPEAYARVVADAAQGKGYFAAIFAATAQGRDLSPRVAARLDVPLAAEVTDLALDGGDLVVTRPVYAGRVFAKVALQGEPRMVSVRPNTFRPAESGKAGAVERLQAPADAGRVKIRELKAAAGAKLDVAEAPVIVSGGRGLKGPENWGVLEQLVEAIGPRAALGASRAVVDAGWRPHAEQVGQTGKTVSPQLYIAVGISGAMQHLAGMRSAKTIVAINKDPDAPIFKVADYGVVGDALEIVPRLAEEIRKLR